MRRGAVRRCRRTISMPSTFPLSRDPERCTFRRMNRRAGAHGGMLVLLAVFPTLADTARAQITDGAIVPTATRADALPPVRGHFCQNAKARVVLFRPENRPCPKGFFDVSLAGVAGEQGPQ